MTRAASTKRRHSPEDILGLRSKETPNAVAPRIPALLKRFHPAIYGCHALRYPDRTRYVTTLSSTAGQELGIEGTTMET